jgi:hypothetical protein
VNYVLWNEASQVAKFYAGNAIPAGTLLNGAMVVRVSNLTAGRDVLGLSLKDGQLPGSCPHGAPRWHDPPSGDWVVIEALTRTNGPPAWSR